MVSCLSSVKTGSVEKSSEVGSTSSLNRPSGFACAQTRSKNSIDSSSRPASASASAHQNEQIVNVLFGAPKSSSCT